MKLPSIKNENSLTWKCKLFGCRNEYLPLVYYDKGEKHGIFGFSYATAATTTIECSYIGCYWCHNYREIREQTTLGFPAWVCDCEICEKSRVK